MKSKSVTYHINFFKFNDSVIGLRSVVVGHVILAFLLYINDPNLFFKNPFVFVSLFTAGVSLLLIQIYSWANWRINLMIWIGYISILILEYQLFQMPDPPPLGQEISKGVLLDILFLLFPMIYTIGRLMLSFSILHVVYTSYRFKGAKEHVFK